MKKKLITLLRFGTVGIGNTLIDFGVFFLLTALNVPYLIAQVCSYTAGILNSYIWNRTWTFRVKEKVRGQEIIRFLIINLAASGITFLLLYGLQKAGLSLVSSKVTATVGGMVINFIGNRLWVFQEPEIDS
ncbi:MULTISPECIES: GtrA family protein [Bacillus]|uniref:GtrA family protein n=1 Tax=Bacillus glycinifermentans TaxID=1664069 RepID=A0AAJ3YWR5_9BACI|nr:MULTISPECIES: GtrA family protein [Bacillus]KKB73308.1 membrane protein [Bacillus sp. TH008]MDU0069513.1 GtrA family protein [Bacillus sp. IG6]MED8017508.1 GtrA family protein [Bacillus glycinifermentans]QAT64654.1 GtrA family protein [Bacillus glycinifermentans]WKB78605.1 GtrA family protein [Bacillus glycinifermentans]